MVKWSASSFDSRLYSAEFELNDHWEDVQHFTCLLMITFFNGASDFINIHYHPSRMILVATGGVDHDHVVALANKFFTRNDKYIGPGTPTFERDVPNLDNDTYANFWKATEFQSCEIRQSYNQGRLYNIAYIFNQNF